MSKEKFLKQYGAKKDKWAMGLLLGSLARGFFIMARYRFFPLSLID